MADGADTPERHSPTPSPRLSRKTQEEIVAENDAASGEDPENYPLHSPWSFWFDKSHRGGDAGDFFANLRRLATVTSIKAFWRVFNNIPTCDKLRERESYHLMRSEQRRPVWEDADNVDGGMWVIKLEKQHTVKAWQELLLAAIGEQLSLSVHPDDEVCGVSVRIRRDSDVIQIWNQDSDLKSSAKVLDRVKELVPSLEIRSTYYQNNREKMRDSLLKPTSGYRGLSPPQPAMMAPWRYMGPSPLFPAPSHRQPIQRYTAPRPFSHLPPPSQQRLPHPPPPSQQRLPHTPPPSQQRLPHPPPPSQQRLPHAHVHHQHQQYNQQ